MPGRVFKRGDIFWVAFSHKGKEYRHSAKTESKREAESVLVHYLGQCARGEFKGFEDTRPVYTVGEMLDDLIQDAELRQLREVRTIRMKTRSIKKAIGSVSAADLTERTIDLYVKARFAVGLKPATLKQEMTYLRQAFALAHRKKLVTEIPYMPRFKINNVRQGFYEQDEFDRLLLALPDWLKDFARFAYYTAWRRNEIATLEWRDMQGDTIRLRPEVSKNSDGRLVIVEGVIAEIIERRQQERIDLIPLVFHVNGRKIKGTYFDVTWRRAAERAGLKGRLFHDLRRTAVRNMDRAGVPRDIAKRMSGHKTDQIYSRYNIVNEHDIREASRKVQEYVARTKPAQFRRSGL